MMFTSLINLNISKRNRRAGFAFQLDRDSIRSYGQRYDYSIPTVYSATFGDFKYPVIDFEYRHAWGNRANWDVEYSFLSVKMQRFIDHRICPGVGNSDASNF